MALSKRLLTLADMVPTSNRIIDVGCDHALLDIYLIKASKIKKALAIDICAKALIKAKENIISSKLEKDIELIHNDGLNNIEISTNDVIVIAGMGRKSIINILENKLNNINKLVIQSNNEHYELRKWLHHQGFIINNEVFIKEKNKTYIIITFNRGDSKYNFIDYWLGPILKNDDSYLNYLKAYYHQLFKQIPHHFIIKRYQVKRKTHLLEKKSWASHIS